MPFQQYLTYQHNVQKYFREHREKYDGIIIPLSIAVSFPSGTYGFVRALCAKDGEKKYAIDPRSALFQKAWNRDFAREPHRKMTQILGGPFEDDALSRPLIPDDFADDDVIEELVGECIDFQKQFRTSEDDQRKLNKYKKLLGLQTMAELGDPQFLIPPYFQFDAIGDEWYEVSARCIAFAVERQEAIPIKPIYHFSQWQNPNAWEPCFNELTEWGVPGVWFYPNNFHEHDASEADLRNYLQVVCSANEAGLSAYTLFGGYYAILLSYCGLGGFGNGIGYGEWRDSGYHRGGSASTRVYVLKLHRFLDAPVAQAIIEQDPEYFGNDTDVISSYVDAGESVEGMSLEDSLEHFMECRKLEVDFVAANDSSTAVEELRETLVHMEDMELERVKYGNSLERWANVIESECD